MYRLSEQCYGHKNNDLTLHLINSASDNDVEVLLDVSSPCVLAKLYVLMLSLLVQLVADSKLEQLAAESRKEDSLAMDGKSVCVSDSPAVGHDTSIFFVDAAGDPELAGTLDVMVCVCGVHVYRVPLKYCTVVFPGDFACTVEKTAWLWE